MRTITCGKFSATGATTNRRKAILRSLVRLFIRKGLFACRSQPAGADGQRRWLPPTRKIVFDENALYKHPELELLRNPEEYGDEELAAHACASELCRARGNDRVHGERRGTCHGDHGHDRDFGRKSGQFSRRRGQLEPAKGGRCIADSFCSNKFDKSDTDQYFRRHHPLRRHRPRDRSCANKNLASAFRWSSGLRAPTRTEGRELLAGAGIHATPKWSRRYAAPWRLRGRNHEHPYRYRNTGHCPGHYRPRRLVPCRVDAARRHNGRGRRDARERRRDGGVIAGFQHGRRG